MRDAGIRSWKSGLAVGRYLLTLLAVALPGLAQAPRTPPSIVTALALPAALAGSPYSQTLAATGSTPITWSVTSGSLSAGLTLNKSTGAISGTPAAMTGDIFRVRATNAFGSNSKQLSLTVNAPPSIATTSPLPAALVNAPYLQTLEVSGSAPITWAIIGGALPAGLALNASTGVINGTPTALGVATFTVTATNAFGASSVQLSLTVYALPSITTASALPAAQTGIAYSQTLTASGSTPITWAVTGGALPAGLTLNASSGVISGTPTALGVATFTVTATNAFGSASKQLSLNGNAPPSVTTTSPLQAAQAGMPYSQTLTASGTTPITWAVTSGALPAGLTLNTSSGVINGTPTAQGTANFTVTATNGFGGSSVPLSLTVNGPPSITTASPLTAAQAGTAYSQTLAASGSAPITWTVSSGALPTGLTLNAGSGAISGTPTALGTASFTVTATNAFGSSFEPLSLTVYALPSITTASPLPAQAGIAYSQTLAASGSTPITWAVTSSTLPAGLTLNASSGVLNGTPSAQGIATFTVTAANAFGSGSEQLSLTVGAPVSVSLSPATAALTAAQTVTLLATVSNTTNTAVVWSLSPAVGTISAGGLYTAPAPVASAQNVTVTATSAADSTKSASAIISLTPVTVSLTPSTVSLLPSQNQTFTASVSGTSNTAVTWSFTPALASLASGGATAVYVAPSTAPTTQTGTITATSTADPSKTATAVITLLQAVTVSLSPTTVSLTPSGTQQFTATVLGSSNTALTWSINPSVGTISSAGLYTAPASILTSQTVTVTAQSVADPTKSASATISLTPSTGTFTYSVDSVNGSDSNPGTLGAPWQTVAKVNATTLLPGQSVAFKAGGVWREQLVVQNSGSTGEPITFAAYGSGALPVIDGSNLLTVWIPLADIYYSSVSANPYQVFRDGVRLTLAASQAAMTTGSWWWDAPNLRIHVFDDPSGHTMEASVRNHCIDVNGQAYITLSGLDCEKALQQGIYSNGVTAAHLTANGVASNYNVLEGMIVLTPGSTTTPLPDLLIENSTFSYNGEHGFISEGTTSHELVQYNVAHHNCLGIYVGYTSWCAGLRALSNDPPVGERALGVIFQYNTVYSNGDGTADARGYGIHFDTTGAGSQIRYNVVHDNDDAGIVLENTSDTTDTSAQSQSVIYNVVYNHNLVAWATGIYVYRQSKYNIIANNTTYGNGYNILVSGLYGGGNPIGMTGNVIKNNLSFGWINYSLAAQYGGENDGTNGSGNVYAYNGLGIAATRFIQWGAGTTESTYSGWETAAGNCGATGCSHSMQSDPRFTNPSVGDFTLQAGSPAIGAGVYIPGVTTNSPNIGAK